MTQNSTKVPDFLIVGAAKSGTSSLHTYLCKHPDIFMPEKLKELHFWHIATNPNRSIINHSGIDRIPTTLADYLKHFTDSDRNQITGEACPAYLYFHNDVLENLKKHHDNWQDVKIIIILREPVSRILSQYRFVCKRRLDPDYLGFSESLENETTRVEQNVLLPDLFYTELSKYARQVGFYLKNFNDVHVCFYDDLKNKPEELTKDLCRFLNVDPNKLPDFNYDIVNASTGAKKLKHPLIEEWVTSTGRRIFGWMPREIKIRLRKILGDMLSEPLVIPEEEVSRLKNELSTDIVELEKIINKDLSDWKT